MRHCLHFGQFDRKPHNVPKLRMPPKARHQPMWRHSKNPSMTVHHVTWVLSLLYYQLFWLFFVCCLPFISIIITEVVLSSSCTGINNIKNRHQPTCLHQNQFQQFQQRTAILQIMMLQNRQKFLKTKDPPSHHHDEPNACLKHSTK